MRRALAAASRAVVRAEEVVIAGCILGIAALTVANVLGRTLLGESLAFADEVTRFLMIGVTFLGLGYAAGKARHIRMTAIHDALPRRARKALMVVVTATTAALLFVLAWLGFRYVLGTVAALGPVSPVLGVPLHLVYMCAPVGFLLAGAQYALAAARNLMEDGIYASFDVAEEEAPPPAV